MRWLILTMLLAACGDSSGSDMGEAENLGVVHFAGDPPDLINSAQAPE